MSHLINDCNPICDVLDVLALSMMTHDHKATHSLMHLRMCRVMCGPALYGLGYFTTNCKRIPVYYRARVLIKEGASRASVSVNMIVSVNTDQ